MAMTNLNIRIDAELKENVENILNKMGLNMTTAFNIFARTIEREKRIPFEISADPFWSAANQAHLRKAVAALNAGQGIERELIEVDDDA